MPDDDVRVTARAPLRPTEDPAKVREALANLFPDAKITVDEREAVAQGGTLARLRELIANHYIQDTARGVMMRGIGPDERDSRFRLGKQAAVVGKPNFGAPASSPLGEIEVLLEAGSVEALERAIYETAPDTTCEPELARVPPRLRPAPLE